MSHASFTAATHEIAKRIPAIITFCSSIILVHINISRLAPEFLLITSNAFQVMFLTKIKIKNHITMYAKKLSMHIRREVNGKFQVATTIIFCFSIAFLVLVLGTIINDHFKKFVMYEDLSLSTLNAFPPLFPFLSSQQCNSSLNMTQSFNEWVSPKDLWHSMSDKELRWRASIVPRIVDYPFDRIPKVAFMFLTRGKLPLSPLWEMFFKGHEGLFSIYLHTLPEFTNEPDKSSVFYKRRIPSKLVQWGKSTMVDAEIRLLANALLDFTNQRFVLLSETCIPLFNFSTVYTHLINANQSFLSTFDDPRPIGRGRYNKRMGPAIKLSDWRKGSQWFEANRELAIAIVSDVTYYPIFRNHCMPPCYMDEHYLPTLVTKTCPNLASNKTITWTDWSEGGSHPRMFKRNDVTQGFLDSIRNGFNCTYNGEMSSICYLFARKFHPSTLQPLLKIAPKLLGFSP